MLEPDEIKRRMEAARILRGISQTELGLLFEADGLGKSDPGRIERGQIPFDRARREAACRHLRVPDAWFTAEAVDEIVGFGFRSDPRQAAEELAAHALEAAQAILRARAQGAEEPGRQGR